MTPKAEFKKKKGKIDHSNYIKEKKRITNAGENVEKKQFLYTFGGK
jgi:hypothetical protein